MWFMCEYACTLGGSLQRKTQTSDDVLTIEPFLYTVAYHQRLHYFKPICITLMGSMPFDDVLTIEPLKWFANVCPNLNHGVPQSSWSDAESKLVVEALAFNPRSPESNERRTRFTSVHSAEIRFVVWNTLKPENYSTYMCFFLFFP